MAVVTKGKKATKGKKQIYEENKQTLKFYQYMSLISMGFYLAVMGIFFYDQIFTFKYVMAILFSLFVHMISYGFLKQTAKPEFDQAGNLLDGGIDLNMEGGMSENFKDLIILTAIVQTLSLISNYFWYAWLFAPGRALYMLWVNVLGPWFFQPAPEEEPIDEKKQRKLDRKMRRAAY